MFGNFNITMLDDKKTEEKAQRGGKCPQVSCASENTVRISMKLVMGIRIKVIGRTCFQFAKVVDTPQFKGNSDQTSYSAKRNDVSL
jgi:hypothetical protein